MFFDKIYTLLYDVNTEDRNKTKILETLCHLTFDEAKRNQLAQQDYYKKVYRSIDLANVDHKILEKISWLTTLLCFHSDMIS